MLINILDSHEELARASAEFVAETAKQSIRRRGRFLLALSGGGTPEPLYRLLASQDYRGRLDWRAAEIFWVDERCVPPDDPGSNYGQAKRLLLDHVFVPDTQIRRIKGELLPEQAAADYREQLAKTAEEGLEWPALDLALMGLGADGHTASLFPGPITAAEDSLAAIPVVADYGGRPAQRVSLTPPVLKSARNVLFLVTGSDKAKAVEAVLGGNADLERWPAARIKPTPGKLYFYLDAASATGLA